MCFLSLNKRNNLLPKLFDFAEIFRFEYLPLILHVQIREKPILKIYGDGMWEKESILDVQCRQENPQPSCPLFQWETASLVSYWNGGPSGWDFPVSTEH